MKILILNWRDPVNPKSGGAEEVLWQYAQHLIKQKHQVTWLSNRFTNAKSLEDIFVRVDPNLPFYNPYLMLVCYPLFFINVCFKAYQLHRREHFDLVIDAIHGLPSFAPLFLNTKITLFVCEVAGTIWDKMYPFPISAVGQLLEKIVYYVYQKCRIWAISESTRRDILQINPQLKVDILPLGIDTTKFKPQKKFAFPSAVFVARLVKMKGIESALAAAKQIVQKLPNFKLFVVGGGNTDYVASLDHGLYVEFLGRADDTIRNKLYAKCHFLLHPSYKEGFGLTVLEAGASGTPTIARKGSSMDELIAHGKDGLLFDDNGQIADFFLKYFKSSQYTQLERLARIKSESYDWKTILKNENLA